jgi:hypothetical protein
MNERHFNKELIKSLNHQSFWAYKIPDVPRSPAACNTCDNNAFRFIPSKPFDVIGFFNHDNQGYPFAIECKQMKEYKAFSKNYFGSQKERKELDFSEWNQVKNLNKFQDFGRSFVFLNIRVTNPGNRLNRLLIFEWKDLLEYWQQGSIKKVDLVEFDYIEGRKGLYSLEKFIQILTGGKYDKNNQENNGTVSF